MPRRTSSVRHSAVGRPTERDRISVTPSRHDRRRYLADLGPKGVTQLPASSHSRSTPQRVINRIMSRVRDASWPEQIATNGWEYGANWDY